MHMAVLCFLALFVAIPFAFLLLGVGAHAFDWITRSEGPLAVDTFVRPDLDAADAWPVGVTPGELVSSHVPLRQLEVEASRDGDRRVLVSVRRRGPEYGLLVELWIDCSVSGAPVTKARACVHGETSSDRSPYHDPRETVRLNSAKVPTEDEDPPWVINYEITGDCSGSPCTAKGRVLVTAADLR